jgi:hypothetical protein
VTSPRAREVDKGTRKTTRLTPRRSKCLARPVLPTVAATSKRQTIRAPLRSISARRAPSGKRSIASRRHGVGAIGGSLALKWLKDELGPDRLVAAGSVVSAFALVLFGLAHEPITAICACFLAGASWTVVITKLYVSAQVELPDWARGRGLAVFLSVIFGATTVGSAVWGKLSAMAGLPIAYFVAAAGVVVGIR